MKTQKKLKTIAKQIYEAERNIHQGHDIEGNEEKIINLTASLEPEEMFIIDELVMKMATNN